MCCTRCLKILICIAAVLISTNGDDNDRLSNLLNRNKQRELDYGERLSSMEDNQHDGLRGELDRQGAPKGPVRLKGGLSKKKKTLDQEQNEQAQSTKCTTDKAIHVDLKPEMKDSDENSPIPDDVTDSNTIGDDTTDSNSIGDDTTDSNTIGDDTTDSNTIGDDTTDSNEYTTGGDESADNTGSGGDDSSATYPSLATTTPAIQVDPRVDGGPPQDPSKDDDYDATVSTKKYYGAHAIFSPDHYLDDA